MSSESLGRLSIRELIVDFLGSLVPGLIFVSTALALLAWPVRSAFEVMLLRSDASLSMSDNVMRIAAAARVELTVLLVMLSYVAGHLFYRQDPKEPDERSFKRSFRNKTTEEWVADLDNVEFPYLHFDRYLKSRNLNHLLPLTEWCATGRRTKNFLNILKIRLFYEYPEKCGSIAKNEAHVRLMASTWYMSRALKWFAGAIIVLTLATATVSPTFLLRVIPAVPAIIVGIIAFATQWMIERFLHYQRVREVMWVLETAYIAYRDHPERLNDICPDFTGQPQPPALAMAPPPEPAEA
jgi:hypothetical protein